MNWKNILYTKGPLFVVSLILFYLIFTNTDIGLLVYYKIDEYAFHGSLQRIFFGITNYDIRLIFGTGFFNYGWLFFIISFLFSLPGFLLNNADLMVVGPRLFSSISAIIFLITLTKILKLNKRKSFEIFLVIFLVCTMPGFWINAIIFHPDWPYTTFLILSIYYLRKDSGLFSKNFKIAILMFSIAFCIKIQSIIFFPLILLYVILNESNKKLAIYNIILASLSLLIARIITNPYLLHPEGFWQFILDFKSLGTSAKIKSDYFDLLVDKFVMLDQYYFSLSILIIFVALNLIFLLNRSFDNFLKIIFWTFIITFCYTFFSINNTFQHYYLPIIILLIISSVIIITKYKLSKYFLIFILLIQLTFNGTNLIKIFDHGYTEYSPKLIEESEIVYNWILDEGSPKSIILIYGNVTLKLKNATLDYINIHRVYGEYNSNVFLEYNSHNPGHPIKKDLVLISKDNLNDNRIAQIHRITIDKGYYIVKEDQENILYKKIK